MKYHDEPQGSPEWLALRSSYFTASEAAAMMGCHPTKTRTELLAEKYHGRAKDVGSFVEDRVFAPGHSAEAAYRPIAEATISDDLFPVTGSIEIEGLRLLASFDGLTMDGAVCFEHKLWNHAISDHIVQTGEPPEYHCWQLEQQLLVAGADRALFVTSDGTQDREARCWYTSQPERRAALLAGWHQFAADLANYTPATAEPPKPTGTAPDTLPALRIEVTGMVTASNLAEFKRTALAAIRSVNRNLKTDQDFADAEASVKWCADVESRIAAAKQHALSQTASIDELFRTLDDVSAEFRALRLDQEKLVKARKDTLRDEIQADAVAALHREVDQANAEADQLCRVGAAPDARQRIAAAMKGKRTIATLRDAADTARAQMAIEAKRAINQRSETLAVWNEIVSKHIEIGVLHNLVPDLRGLLAHDPEHFRLVVNSRWDKHIAALAEREAKERARIRAEEQAKAERAARELVEAERLAEAARQHAEDERQREAARAQSEAAARQWAERVIETLVAVTPAAPQPALEAANTPSPAQATGPMLKLGEINARLAPISISADGLAQLGFTPDPAVKTAKLYRAADLPLILDAMVQHIKGVGLALYLAA